MIGHSKRDLDTPALLLDLAAMDRNIERMATTFREAGVGWRPHTKAIKIPAIAHKLLRAGAHGITCAKVSEADVMVAGGIRDILIANQVVGEAKITRLVNLLPHADVIVAVDNPANVEQLDRAACAKGYPTTRGGRGQYRHEPRWGRARATCSAWPGWSTSAKACASRA